MNQRRSGHRFLFAGLAAAFFPACAHLAAPARNGGPTRSAEGVELAVAGKSCAETQEPDWYGDDLAELTLQVRVRNPTNAPVTIHREDLRLLVPAGGALRTISWRAAEPLPVAVGETKAFEIRFMSRGVLACGAAPELETRGSVTMDDKVLPTGRIAFTPSAPSM